jgi:hypothetical protein
MPSIIFMELNMFITIPILLKNINLFLTRDQTKKPFSKMPKGWKWSGSPDCNIDRTFSSIFYFPYQVKKTNQIKHVYRNPIYLAREYKRMIDNRQVKNQTGLAQKIRISRAKVTQIFDLLKLDSFILQELEKLGNPSKTRIITERMLQP